MTERNTPRELADITAMNVEQSLQPLLRIMDELENVLIDAKDDYQQFLDEQEDDDSKYDVYLEAPDYDEQLVHIEYALDSFLDELNNWQRRLGKIKKRIIKR